jgi:mono/diheme cytochrome c family protein
LLNLWAVAGVESTGTIGLQFAGSDSQTAGVAYTFSRGRVCASKGICLRLSCASVVLCLLVFSSFAKAQNGDEEAGRQIYDNDCSVCHGGDGLGGEHGPQIARRLRRIEDPQLTELIHQGRAGRGMPSFPTVTGEKLDDLIAFLHTLKSQRKITYVQKKVQTTSGETLEGSVLNESVQDLALRTSDEKIHLLRPEGDRYREVTSQVDWTPIMAISVATVIRNSTKFRNPTWLSLLLTGCSPFPMHLI